MKKLLILILALVMCLSFTSCDAVLQYVPDEVLNFVGQYIPGLLPEEEVDPDAVIGGIYALYNTPTYKNAKADYTVENDADGIAIKWTSNTDVVKVVEADGKTTIDLPESNDEELSYTLTATITVDGKDYSCTIKCTLPVYKALLPTVNAPEEGVAYKLSMYQNDVNVGQLLFATAEMDQGKYFKTSAVPAEGLDFYVEKAEGGFKFYYNDGNAKKYVEAYLVYDEANDKYSKRLQYSDNGTVWAYDAETNSWQTTLNQGETPVKYVLGTYSDFRTFCISEASYITAENTGVSQFPAALMLKTVTDTIKPEHKCEHICVIEACGKCTDADCTEKACTDKCAGHSDLIPAADSTITIEQAINIGSAHSHNKYTEGKYYIVVKIEAITNTTYGNMTVSADGKTLTVYGTYNADGSAKYGDMENKPAVGDTVKLYGILGSYNKTAQMKNAWIVEVSHEHVYADVTVDANCTTAGSVTPTCSCGEVDAENVTTTAPLHKGLAGECSVCGNFVIDISTLAAGKTSTETELVEGSGVYTTKALDIEANNKHCGDFAGDYQLTMRLKLGGKMISSGKVNKGLKVVLAGPAKVTVYAYSSSSSEDRTLEAYDESLTALNQGVLCTGAGDELVVCVFTFDAAGTYYIGGVENALNVYYIEIAAEETEPVEPAPEVTVLVDGTVANKVMSENLTYITNNASYPDASFYSDGGLKLNFVNQGVSTATFAAQTSVKVTLTFNALNSNTKSEKADVDAFTVYGLDAEGNVVATATTNTITDKVASVTLEGTGIVSVKVIMTDYYYDGTVCYNLSLAGLKVETVGATETEPVEPAPEVTVLVDGTVANKVMSENLTYITNSASYPDASFYSDGGLKLNFVNQGVSTATFAAQTSVKVTLTFNALNSNTKSEKADVDAFTVYGLDAEGNVVATATTNTITDKVASVTLEGTGIVSVKVIMTDYYYDGTVCYNLSLANVKVETN